MTEEICAEVLVRREGACGVVSLNRPRALHALNLGMVRTIVAALLAWRDDPAVATVWIDHAPAPDGDPKLSRGFCAGGDITMMRRSALEDGGASARAFFLEEYQLNHLIFTYPKPVVAFMDGITMGGGVGLACPARWRVATAKTVFAMPEAAIGLFPDVGGGWYLSRLAGRLGRYLALTGARLDGAECLWAGLATHFLEAGVLAEAKARLAAGEAPEAALDGLAGAAPAPAVAARMGEIDRLFASDRYEDILAALSADTGAFAAETLAALASKSPTTCKVALRQLATSAGLADFADNMRMEYGLAARIVVRPDLAEGVRALLIDKDNAPHWQPATAEAVSEAMLDDIFAPLPASEEWRPL